MGALTVLAAIAQHNPAPFGPDEHERLAQAQLDPAVWAYVQGGAADEITVARNRAAWQTLQLMPRVLRDLRGGHTQQRLLGQHWPCPIMVAPMAAMALVHPEGERAVALAAAAQGVGLLLSGQSSWPCTDVLASVRGDAGRGPLWQHLALRGDDGLNAAMADAAADAGAEALVLGIDAPVQGVRERQYRAGFTLPPGAVADPRQRFEPPPTATGGLCAGWIDQAPTWRHVDRLRAHTRLPIWLKGVMHPADARQALALGCDGLIISNHGGRTLDTAPATAQMLPRIRQAVGADCPLLVDGGIRRGTDIVKALALGAQGVLIGRPVLHALAIGGAAAVARLMRLWRDELEMAMALCGCATVQDIATETLA